MQHELESLCCEYLCLLHFFIVVCFVVFSLTLLFGVQLRNFLAGEAGVGGDARQLSLRLPRPVCVKE